MATRTRLNLYFDPALIPQIEAMALRRSVALRRNVSKSAIVEGKRCLDPTFLLNP